MNDLFLGKGERPVHLLARYGNRHGLVAGATGTGKSVTLMLMAEGFSRMGVPVFMADVKGDIAGLAVAGTMSERLQQRIDTIGLEGYGNEGNPVVFWDLYARTGHPVRTTVSQMGPTLLSRVLELNDTQSGVIDIVFRLADEEGLLLLDLDDLRALLGFAQEHRQRISTHYGLVSTQSIGAIQRALLRLESAGGKQFFGEPALELAYLMRQDMSGRGVINLLDAEKLILQPRLYSTFLLWLLSELFETLPEVGDLDQPKLVFFFDEAHLLFNDCPPALRQRVEQVVRLIRSKGVGVYFCSQLPDDVPNDVLGQLGNRVQHALRAFTPRDQKAVRVAAETFVPNPNFKVVDAITRLGVGEALVSTLQDKGVPMPVEQTLIAPPRCRMGVISDEERATVRSRSPVGARYDTPVNRESAYEILAARAAEALAGEEAGGSAGNGKTTPAKSGTGTAGAASWFRDMLFGTGRRQGAIEAVTKSTMRTMGNQLGRQILRGALGGLAGGSTRKR